MKKLLTTILLSVLTILSPVSAQNPTAIADPAGTVLSVNPGSFTPTLICGSAGGDIIAEPNTSGTNGTIFRYTNSSWAAYGNSPCVLYGVSYNLSQVIDANRNAPVCDPAAMDNMTYNSGLSNLANGIIVYTGTTEYTYRSFGVNRTELVNTRCVISFTDAATVNTIQAFDDGTRLYIPVSGDFDMRVYIEAQSPSISLADNGCAAGQMAGGIYYGAIELFDRMANPTPVGSYIICTSFTPGSFYQSAVTALASNTGPVAPGGSVDLNASETAGAVGPITYSWTGPASYGTQNVTINPAGPADNGAYTVTVTDLFGCQNTAVTNLIVSSDTDGDGIDDSSDNCVSVFNPSQVDVDGDGYGAACDCNDNNASINPGMPEVNCNGIDDDCDPLTVEAPAPTLQTVVPLDQGICPNTSANIQINGSQLNVDYYLRDDSDDAVVDGPIAGTGSPLIFNTGNLTATTNYNILATSTSGYSALDFEGGIPNAEYVNLGNNALFDITGDITIETWVNVDSYPADWARLVGKGTGANRTYGVWISNTGALLWQMWGSTIMDLPGPVLTPGVWYHVAAVRSGNTCSLYVNGVLSASSTYTDTPFLSTEPATLASDLLMHDYFDGQMDEVRIWNVARSASDISSNMNICLDGNEAGLVANYSMQDGTGSSVVADKTSNALNGTLMNMDPSTDWVQGVASCTNCEIQMTPVVTVTVDNTAPVAVCQDITVSLDASGNATITAADIDGGSTDFCPVTLSIPAGLGSDQFDCTTLGANTVTLTVTDDNGNTATCDAIVTVVENTAPTAICQDITVQLDAAGSATIATTDIDNGSNDACGIASMSLDITSFDCSNVGANTVTLTVTDNNGNVSTCTSTVTVQDNVAPTAICQDITVQLDATGSATIATTDIDNGSNDACGIASMSLDATSFDCTNLGTNTVTLTVTDNNGNVSTCTSTVTVEDNVAPVAICQDITVQLDATGNATILPAQIDNGSSDNCSSVELALDITSFDCSNVGPNTVTLTVSEAPGTVLVSTPPSGCIGHWTFEPGQELIDLTGNWSPLTINGSASISNGKLDVDNAPNGYARAIGYSGAPISNKTLVAYLTLDDYTVLAGSPLTIDAISVDRFDGLIYGEFAANRWQNGSNGGVRNSPFVPGFAESTNDEALQIAISYEVVGPNVTITGYRNGVQIGNYTIGNAATWAAGDIEILMGIRHFAGSPIGSMNAKIEETLIFDRVLTPLEISNLSSPGVQLSSTCTSTVTVQDNIAPTAICQDITVQLDATGSASITTTDIDNGSNDACGIASMSLDVTSFDCSNVGANTVTLTVTDNNGNVSTCTSTVTVQDNVAPTAICQDITIQLDAVGSATIVPADIDNGSNDACGIASMSLDVTSFDCSNVGANTVTLTVTDNNGNVSTCTSTVTVQDLQAPMVVCPSDITLNAVTNNCGRIVTYNMVAVDNCSFTVTQTDGTGYASGDLFPVGVTPQSFEITDQFGNTTLCSFNVTIVDNQLPSITGCPANITVNTQAGVCQSTVSWIQPTASDNCPGVIFSTSHAPGSVFPLGTTTVTYTATDASGNVSTCNFNVTVVDNEAPIFVDCPSDITINNDPGLCEAVTLLGSPTVTDNCSLASVTPSFTGPFPVGTTVVTWTAVDGSGNTSTCTQNVNVVDNENPVAVCANITVQLDATGNATIVASDIDGGSTDNCGVGVLTASQTSFDCTNIGTNNVTLTVEDIYGNQSTCIAVVTVEDNVAPNAICQDITVQLDATGNVTISGSDIDNGSNDACGISSVAVAPSAFTCANIGANAVILTVTDNNGNVSTCNATVTVQDNVAPTAICQDITIQLDATGNASIVPADIDGGSTDACGVASISADITNFSCADLGANTVTLTVTDNNGNVSTCTSTVTVQDNVAPIAICQDITVQLDATGNVSIAGIDVDGGSTDACGGLTYSVTPNAFTCAEVGVNIVTLTVSDASGNSATCTANVTVEDNVAPVVNCADITVQLDATGNATIVPADVLPNNPAGYIIDQTGTFAPVPVAGTAVPLSDDQMSGALPIGFNFNFYGNSYSQFYLSSNGFLSFSPATLNGCCSGGVIPTNDLVNDVIAFDWDDLYPPGGGSLMYQTIGVAPNRQLVVSVVNMPLFPNSTPDVTSQVILYENSNIIEIHTTQVTSDGSNQTMGIENATGTLGIAVPGRNSATWTASNDYVAFIPVPITGASDACGISTTTLDITSFDCSNVGPNLVTVTVTDNNGNVTTCTSTVTVEDNIAPVANCQDITVQLDALGSASILASDIDNGSTDACGVSTVSVTPSSFNCQDLGDNTVTLTVTDVNGNVSTCTAVVTVEDLIAPTITCPGDISVSNDPGVCGAVVTYSDPIFDDNCLSVSISLVQNTDFTVLNSLACTAPGNITNTARYYDLIAEGVSGNLEVTSVDFGVANVNGPVADQIQLNLYIVPSFPIPTAALPAPFYTETVNVPVGAIGTVYTHTLGTPQVVPAGSILLYELSVDSNNGAYSHLVGSNDSGAATANETQNAYINGTCGVPDYVTFASLGFPSFAPIMTVNGFQTMALNQTAGLASGDVFPIGTTTNTFEVTDESGNTSTCSFNVTVTDNENPVAVCNNITVQLDATGNVSITAADIDGGSTDNCGIASTSIDITSFDCSNVGTNAVTLTIEDIYGNVSTCTSTVTVEDNVAPTAICQDIVVQLDAAGSATIATTDIDNGSNDACGIASMSLDVTSFDCSNVGANTVTLTVTDNNGNVSTCTSTVTVQDNVAPTAICQDIVVQLDAAGSATIATTDIDNGSNDACGIASMTLDVTSFDCSNVGANTVTLTVTDNNGNVSTCTSTVTVQDNIAPTAICQDITVQLDAAGSATIAPTDIDNGSNDACGIASMTLDVTSFDCTNLGANTVTLTVTDNNGNVSTCTSTVTVEDNIPPVITCPADVVVSADPGVCDASSVAFGTATAVDNCSATVTISNDAPLVFPLGNTTVTWTATDLFGNSSTCSQIVTVIDSENPVITCPANVVVNNDPGSCSASAVPLGMATATDNCGSVTVTNNAPAVFPLGITNVTWTATDDAGNSITCVQTVTVNDNEAPIVTCPTDIIVGTDAGGCFATGVALGSPNATDNCTIASITNNAPLSYPLGTTVVTWMVTDMSGNSTSCTQNVTVEDNEVPSIVCPANQTVSADAGTCESSTVSLGSPLTFDNCTVASVVNDAPAIFPLGNTTVTWTVTDMAGNSASCTQVITVVDNENPTIACNGPITANIDPGTCGSSSVVLVAPTANDNCGVASITNNAPATFPLGNTTVTWTVTDNSGNTATCTQTVTIVDNENPTILCPSDVVIGTAGGSCTVSFVALGTPVTSDNCTVASVTNDAPVTYALGTTIVTWTVTDGAGNTATCTQNVTVVDNEAPQINCPADVLVTADPGVCEATGVVIGSATGSDNCTLASITNDAPAAVFPLGVTVITWTATDAAGNVATCTQTVTVTDNELPTITCPADVMVSADAGTCGAGGVILGTPVVADNCSIASVTNNAPAIFPLGNTTVTWAVVDGSGNTASCNQIVTVTDDELPVIICSSDIVIGTIPGLCEGTTTLIAPTTIDNCSVASVVNDAPAFYPLGTTNVAWTVTDGSGNVATCVQTVTVEDTEAPTIFCPSDITVSTDPGMCEAVVALGSPIVNDNCNIASVTNDAPASFPIGSTVVTWTIVDDFGNSASCTQVITVEDNEAPLITCPGDITVNNVPGNCGRNVSYLVPTFMDNCNVTAMTQTDGTGLTSGSWFPIGTTLQEFTVVDEAGNSFSCSFTVTVVDNELPLISNCPSDITVYSTSNTCDVQVNYGTPVISDNCSGTSYTASHFSGEMFPVGLTTVTYTAVDNSGNTASCSFNIEVIDTISPVAPSLASVQGGCAVTLPTPVASDNCSGEINGTTTTVFPVTATGITAVTWTFTDASGNTTTVDQYISIDGFVDATVSYVNDVTLISNNSTDGATYQWIDCNTGLPIAGANNISYVAPINGSYAVEITEPGCTPVTSNCYIINSVGLDDVTIEDMVVYPNPSLDGKFTIKYEGTIEKVDVVDMIGRIITVPMAYDNKYVDGSELANGKYMLRIYTNNGIVTKEVIITNK